VARRKRNQTTENQGAQSTLPPAADERLDVPMLETWLWDAACAIRGADGRADRPRAFTTIYDPACGSGGLLIKARLLYERRHPEERSRAPKLFGQELNPVTFAMAKMNMFLHGYTDSSFAIGDTLRKPGFGPQGRMPQFDYVVTNPMWNQKGYEESFYENDNFSRFGAGTPPKSSADWGWAQHVLAALKEGGRAAVVLDTGAVSGGSGSKSANKEKKIRQAFFARDGTGARSIAARATPSPSTGEGIRWPGDIRSFTSLPQK
jgi:hypothetical protein